jgi:50S ribosomal protein L16 3-hydroxylase
MAKRRAHDAYDEVTSFAWDDFVARWWERRIVVFRGTGASPFTPADVFACAVEAGQRQLGEVYDLTARRAVQFSIDGQQQTFVEPWLPTADDRDLAGYAARVRRSLGRRRHALLIAGFHSHSFALWSRERALFAPLWRRIGLPLTGAITTLFHGDYEATPAGVHKDRFATFLFALSGCKRMRFWPSRPWTEPVTTLTEYRAHLATSFAIDVEPGDILYWPSSYYHIGESAGGLATSVNVGIPIDDHRASYDVDDLLLGMVDDVDLPESARRRSRLRPGRARPLERVGLGGRLSATLPAALRGAVTQFQHLTAPRVAEHHVRSLGLARQSAAGFEPPPPAARRVRLRDRDRVRGDRAHPVWLVPAHGARGAGWLCAANGHVLPVFGHPAIPALGAALGSGRPHRVDDLLRPFTTRARQVRALLAHLIALRALEIVPPPGVG